jgi:hypothetical protein
MMRREVHDTTRSQAMTQGSTAMDTGHITAASAEDELEYRHAPAASAAATLDAEAGVEQR